MPTKFCTGSSVCSNHKLEVKETREREAITDCKEFVVVGNGPSGLALSYLLSGHWPYYTGQSQDEFLHTRLSVEPHLSLVEQDLEFLSDVSRKGRFMYCWSLQWLSYPGVGG